MVDMSSDTPRDQNTVTAAASGSQTAPVVIARNRHIGLKRGLVWLAVVALIFAAWPVYKGMLFKSGSGFGYYIGIIGSVMMLLMLLYPVRKHMRFAQNWGPLRYWFMMHMTFGIFGPLLVLFHTTFHVKSMNATISLFSMLLVASSGLIGRFIYTRIHHGLYGVKSDLKGLQQAVDANQKKVNTVLLEAPGISDQLQQFRIMSSTREGSSLSRAWKFMTLGRQRRKLQASCSEDLRRAVVQLARPQGWNQEQQDQHWQEATSHVSDYLGAIQQAAQYSAYERLFRLWHILHTPFVWLLAISAVVHVIAVNMY